MLINQDCPRVTTKIWRRRLTLPLCMILLVSALVAQENTNVVPPDLSEDDASVVQIGSKYPEIQTAVTLFGRGDPEGAELQMKRAKEKYPELPPAGVLMGKLYLSTRNLLAARTELEKAVRDDPGDPEAYVVFGNTALQNRAFTDAMLLYQKAAEVAETYTRNAERKKNLAIRAYSGIAAVAEAREQWDQAEPPLRKLLELDPENLQAMLRLGRVIFKQDKATAAYDIFQEAYRLDKEKVARPEVNMARFYSEAGDDARAKQLMGLAKERDPKSLPTRLAIAQWALETDRLEEADENAKAAAAIAPEDFQVHLLQGVLARVNKDFPAAETAFTKAHLHDPANIIVLNQLAIALAEQEDDTKRERAAAYAQMASRLAGDRSTVQGRESLVVLAWVLFKANRLPQADALVQQALSAGGVSDDLAYFAARIFYETKRTDVALQLLNRALDSNKRLFPNRRSAQELRSKILRESKIE